MALATKHLVRFLILPNPRLWPFRRWTIFPWKTRDPCKVSPQLARYWRHSQFDRPLRSLSSRICSIVENELCWQLPTSHLEWKIRCFCLSLCPWIQLQGTVCFIMGGPRKIKAHSLGMNDYFNLLGSIGCNGFQIKWIPYSREHYNTCYYSGNQIICFLKSQILTCHIFFLGIKLFYLWR